jgi:hypothetical protein
MNNKDIIQNEIRNKIQYARPYYATNRSVGKTVTDFDDFPYNRWYRGIATNPNPVIIEREAGYRYVEKNCYIDKQSYTVNYPKHCFEAPCSTVYPCTPDYFKKYNDQDAMNVMLNRACVFKSP